MTIAWLTPHWPAPANVHALSSLRTGGVSTGVYASLNLGEHVGDSPVAVAANRRALRQAAALPAEPRWLRQVHGTAVADLDGAAEIGPADAAITRSVGCVCAILTADCLPVLFADVEGAVVGAAHAGWRGLAAGVLENAVRAMQVPPSRLLAWIGPGIGPEHFEVGAEVRREFVDADPASAVCFRASPAGRFLADLAALARRRLQAAGVARIDDIAACTYGDANRFFSYRRDGGGGRQATLIWRD